MLLELRTQGLRTPSLSQLRSTFYVRHTARTSNPYEKPGLGNAPWTVLTAYDELSDGFLGGIRLLINLEHPVGQLALDPKAASRVSGLLHADVMRLLIANVAARGEGVDESSYDEGSVGQVLETMCQGILNMSLRTATRLYREDPARFDLVLHDHLDPLAGVIA